MENDSFSNELHGFNGNGQVADTDKDRVKPFQG